MERFKFSFSRMYRFVIDETFLWARIIATGKAPNDSKYHFISNVPYVNETCHHLSIEKRPLVTAKDSIGALPKELIIIILTYLDCKTLLKLSETCHYFYHITHSDALWKKWLRYERDKIKMIKLITEQSYILRKNNLAQGITDGRGLTIKTKQMNQCNDELSEATEKEIEYAQALRELERFYKPTPEETAYMKYQGQVLMNVTAGMTMTQITQVGEDDLETELGMQEDGIIILDEELGFTLQDVTRSMREQEEGRIPRVRSIDDLDRVTERYKRTNNTNSSYSSPNQTPGSPKYKLEQYANMPPPPPYPFKTPKNIIENTTTDNNETKINETNTSEIETKEINTSELYKMESTETDATETIASTTTKTLTDEIKEEDIVLKETKYKSLPTEALNTMPNNNKTPHSESSTPTSERIERLDEERKYEMQGREEIEELEEEENIKPTIPPIQGQISSNTPPPALAGTTNIMVPQSDHMIRHVRTRSNSAPIVPSLNTLQKKKQSTRQSRPRGASSLEAAEELEIAIQNRIRRLYGSYILYRKEKLKNPFLRSKLIARYTRELKNRYGKIMRWINYGKLLTVLLLFVSTLFICLKMDGFLNITWAILLGPLVICGLITAVICIMLWIPTLEWPIQMYRWVTKTYLGWWTSYAYCLTIRGRALQLLVGVWLSLTPIVCVITSVLISFFEIHLPGWLPIAYFGCGCFIWTMTITQIHFPSPKKHSVSILLLAAVPLLFTLTCVSAILKFVVLDDLFINNSFFKFYWTLIMAPFFLGCIILFLLLVRVMISFNRHSASRCPCFWWNLAAFQIAFLFTLFFVLILIKLDLPTIGFLRPRQVEQLDRMYFSYCFIPLFLIEFFMIIYYAVRAFTSKIRPEVLKNPFTFFAGDLSLSESIEEYIV